MDRIKDKKQAAAYWTAIVSFCLGWAMVIAGFLCDPKGEVSNSVLWIMGESMIYTASVFGVTMYFGSQMSKFKEDTRKYLEDKQSNEE